METNRWEQKLDSYSKALSRLAVYFPEMVKFRDKMLSIKSKGELNMFNND